MRRTEKYGDGEINWLCMFCGQEHFDSFCEAAHHILVAHEISTLLVDTENWIAYEATEDTEDTE